MDVSCNGICEHKQVAQRERQTELLARFLSKPSNINSIELSLGDHSTYHNLTELSQQHIKACLSAQR